MNRDINEVLAATKVLGVEEASSLDEVKHAYRRFAIKYHPDKSNEKEAAQRFKEGTEAFAIIQEYVRSGGTLPVKAGKTFHREQSFQNPDGSHTFIWEGFASFDQEPPQSVLNSLFSDAMGFLDNLFSGAFNGLSNGFQTVIRGVAEDGQFDLETMESIFDALGPLVGIEEIPQPVRRIGRGVRTVAKGLNKLQKLAQPNPQGEFSVMPKTLDLYMRKSNNGSQAHPLWGTLTVGDSEPQTGTYWVSMPFPNIARIEGKDYNIVVKSPQPPSKVHAPTT